MFVQLCVSCVMLRCGLHLSSLRKVLFSALCSSTQFSSAPHHSPENTHAIFLFLFDSDEGFSCMLPPYLPLSISRYLEYAPNINYMCCIPIHVTFHCFQSHNFQVYFVFCSIMIQKGGTLTQIPNVISHDS